MLNLSEIKPKVVHGGLVGVAISLGFCSWGAVTDSPLMYLSGIAGVFGSGGGVAVGLVGAEAEKRRLSGIVGNSRQSFADGYAKGWDECRLIKDDELVKTAQESFDNGYQKAVQATTEELSEQHRKELGNLREMLSQEHEIKITKIREEHATKIKDLIGQHGLELENQKADYEGILAQLKEQMKAWEDKELFLEMKEREYHDWRVDIAEGKGLIQRVEQENLDLQNRLAEVDAEFKNRMLEAENRMRDGMEQSYQQGYSDALDKADLEIQKYRLNIARLETKLGVKTRDDKFNRSLPTLAKALAGNFKPTAFCGGQGSGKGTSVVAMVKAVTPSDKIGAIPVVLDVSEGGGRDTEHTTWYQAGIPSTNDPREFLRLMRVLNERYAERLYRMAPGFDQQPPVCLVVDELQTVLNSLDKEERREFIEIITNWHTRGKKKAIYLYLCTQSYQIQNMGPKGNPIVNEGQLNNFDIVLLNDELKKYIDDNAKKYQDWELHQYLESFERQYQAALLRSKKLTPIRHPSHHRIDQKDKEPSEFIDPVVLATIPQWLQPAFKNIFIPPNAVWASPAGSPEGIEPSPRGEVTDDETPKLPPAGGGAGDGEKNSPRNWPETLDVSPDKISAFEDAVIKGGTMTRAIEQILGISKGGKSRRYQLAKQLYQEIKKANLEPKP